MKLGLVGSADGITKKQEDVLIRLVLKYLAKYRALTLCHADTKGGDERIHSLIINKHLGSEIHIFPPEDESIRAHLDREKSREGGIKIHVEHAKPHHLRYQEIINACDVIIAFPSDAVEKTEDDVWHTIRMSKSKNKPVVIVLPDASATRWPSAGNKNNINSQPKLQ